MIHANPRKWLAVVAVVGLTTPGCQEPPPKPPASGGHAAHAPHAESGPHGGELIVFGDHSFHAEVVTVDDKITLYTLDGDVKEPVFVPEQEPTMNLMLYGSAEQFKFSSASQAGDPTGNTSRFEITSGRLVSALNSEAQDTAELTIRKDGKPYIGKFESHGHHDHHHGHSHGGHDEDNRAHEVLTWHKQVDLAGFAIQLGQHGMSVRAGKDLEPAVTVSREGKAISDAKFYATLLAEDGRAVLSEEALAVFEEATEDEPAHYAPSALRVPKDAARVVIRYRIVLPAGAGSETFDIRLDTVATN